jgi:4-amino-4-deoxy-L-arabinose transferase-like glycosyltransferase
VSERRGARVSLLLLGLAATWLLLLGFRGLFNPDEGRYAEIPREMLASGDWVIPHLDGLVYIEKPPLQYWATALGYVLFGQTDWSARLYTGLSGLATVLLTAAFARRLWGPAAGWRSGIMLGSSLIIMLLSHQLTLDMSLTLYTTLTLVAFCIAQDASTEPRHRARWMWLAWTGAAAAFLTKGLIAGVLPILTLMLYSVLQRDFGVWRRLGIAGGLPLFLLLAAPWFVLIQHRLPQFFDFFVVREHFQRFATRVEDRYQPWWFFLEILAIGCLPWIAPTVRALLTGWRASRPSGSFDARRLLWVWSIVVLVFFSASDSKLIPYILPMFPALALLTGTAPEERLRRDLRATALGLIAAAGVFAVGAALLPRFLHDPARAPYFLDIRTPLVLIAVTLVIGGCAARLQRGSSLALTSTIGASSYAAFAGVLWAASLLTPVYSGATLMPQLRPLLAPETPIYSVRTYDQSLTFYLQRTVTLVDWRGELDFGLTLEPHKGIASLDSFMTRWRAEGQALAVMEPDTYAQLQAAQLPMVLRASVPHELVVSRR